MKKTKEVLLILLVFLMSIMYCGYSSAHSVELDPESLITMPNTIYNGNVTITVSSSVSNYTLYYQAVSIPDSVFSQLKEIKSNGQTEIKTIEAEAETLKTEANALKTTCENAAEAYQDGINNNVDEDELEELREAYETALTNYNDKVEEYNNKIEEGNNKIAEIDDDIDELTPGYIESNWKQATDNSFTIDSSQISGQQSYVIWIKLVTSDNTYYDEGIYTINGTKEDNISVTGITLDESELTINVGDVYTLTAIITPSDATNKSVYWTSDNENVLTISNDGAITAVAKGKATITATTVDGGYTATCEVTVKDSTIATVTIPKTGISYKLLVTIGATITIGYIAYRKIKYINF